VRLFTYAGEKILMPSIQRKRSYSLGSRLGGSVKTSLMVHPVLKLAMLTHLILKNTQTDFPPIVICARLCVVSPLANVKIRLGVARGAGAALLATSVGPGRCISLFPLRYTC
jgi:hypothetical protein